MGTTPLTLIYTYITNEGGLTFVDGKLEKADLHYIGKVPRGRAFADSYSKVSITFLLLVN